MPRVVHRGGLLRLQLRSFASGSPAVMLLRLLPCPSQLVLRGGPCHFLGDFCQRRLLVPLLCRLRCWRRWHQAVRCLLYILNQLSSGAELWELQANDACLLRMPHGSDEGVGLAVGAAEVLNRRGLERQARKRHKLLGLLRPKTED